jgi:hypothetical protein
LYSTTQGHDVTDCVAALETIQLLLPHLLPLARLVLVADGISSTSSIPMIVFASAVVLVATTLVGR